MPMMNGEQRTWLHGCISVLMGLCLLWTMTAAQPIKYAAVDVVNTVLYYPEKPFMELRMLLKFSSNWVLERASLNERVSQLELENRQLSEALQKASVKVPPQKAFYVPALVTLRYPEEWWQELRINKGLKDGVREGAAVTSEGSLIGRVVRLGDHYAWVELITSSSFLLAAAVDETRDLGVINGDGMGNLRLLYIPPEKVLKHGMNISTSLINDHIPPGLKIGTIIGEDELKDGYIPRRVRSNAHMTQLYNVEVFSAAAGGENR